MRRAVLALVMLTGCGKGSQSGPNVADARLSEPQEQPYHNAEDGPVRVGDAMVSVAVSLKRKDPDGYPVSTIGVYVGCGQDSKPFILKGWSADFKLMESLSGKKVRTDKTTEPLPVNFAATTDNGQSLRGIMRTVGKVIDGEFDPKSLPTGTKEVRVTKGERYLWTITFEQATENAKRILVDLDAADLGATGRIRLSSPASGWVKKD